MKYSGIFAAVVLSAIFVVAPTASAVELKVVNTGDTCEPGGIVVAPYSVVYLNGDNGSVLHIEHVSCDGVRTYGDPNGNTMAYEAYESTLFSDNVPRLEHGMDGIITVSLEAPARIEVRDAATGTLIVRLPTLGAEQQEYSVSAIDLEQYKGNLIVVDVIRTTDHSYRGTASISYVSW